MPMKDLSVDHQKPYFYQKYFSISPIMLEGSVQCQPPQYGFEKRFQEG